MSKGNVGNVEIINNTAFKWTIPNFSAASEMKTGHYLRSHEFCAEEDGRSYKWRLELYPNGLWVEDRGFLSIYLESRTECVIDADYSISIINNKNEQCHQTGASKYYQFNACGGFRFKVRKFIELTELMSNAKDMLQGDNLTVLCEISTDSKSVKNSLETTSSPVHKLSNDFGKYIDNQQFSDVKFTIGDETLHAHKIILSIRSPVFNAMFEHDMEENKKNQVEITDIRYEVFKSLLQYIYCGKVEEIGDSAVELYSAADKYQLDDLKTALETQLIKSVSVKNALEMFTAADLHGAPKLKAKAKEFMSRNAQKIVKNPEFKSVLKLHEDVAMEIIQALTLKD